MENEENQKQVSHRFPQPLEIANDAIPTFPQPRRGAEKWKTKPRFPTFPLVVLFFSERRPGDRFAPLQAHSSIRICLLVCFACLLCRVLSRLSCEGLKAMRLKP